MGGVPPFSGVLDLRAKWAVLSEELDCIEMVITIAYIGILVDKGI